MRPASCAVLLPAPAMPVRHDYCSLRSERRPARELLHPWTPRKLCPLTRLPGPDQQGRSGAPCSGAGRARRAVPRQARPARTARTRRCTSSSPNGPVSCALSASLARRAGSGSGGSSSRSGSDAVSGWRRNCATSASACPARARGRSGSRPDGARSRAGPERLADVAPRPSPRRRSLQCLTQWRHLAQLRAHQQHSRGLPSGRALQLLDAAAAGRSDAAPGRTTTGSKPTPPSAAP